MCQRPCDIGDTRVCHYDFRVQEYFTMSRACYNCPDNLTDCSREECIAADGVTIPVLAVNRQLPGPSIQVSQAPPCPTPDAGVSLNDPLTNTGVSEP